MNEIKDGAELPKDWAEGAIVHIYKNKGEIDECASYRPICLTQIIYKIWSQLLTKRLSKILHSITSTHQFGYKTSLSTADAIVKLEAHLTKATPENILY